ncbi:hypothetical protein K523DRAFT_340622 [Schizophyllum commune Tattone D]|nr:hypothetical protein K523DRAFT_340622 [Schizophyllum commune Tattone D]
MAPEPAHDQHESSDEDDEEFVYPGAEPEPPAPPAINGVADDDSDDDEEFVYPGAEPQSPTVNAPGVISVQDDEDSEEEEFIYPGASQEPEAIASKPSPAQLESLFAAASSGDLALLKKLFATAQENSHVDSFQLANCASTRTGLTALHAAASRGFKDMVQWLNAASKGHLPVVQYLLRKQKADPMVRNNWGETAYDVAAAVFEVWICEVLEEAEAERWQSTSTPYDPLAVHTTVPVLLYEHQRLDTRLKTLATNGRPKFTASGLGRNGRPAPFVLRLPKPDTQGTRTVPAWRSDVQLPLRDEPFKLPRPGQAERPALEGAERSHFWLSDWTLDVTHPRVDAVEGWQYARRLSDPDDQWTAEVPPQLERVMSGIAAGLASPQRSRSSSSSSNPSPQSWVRRRRWVRVMRRRLDIPPLPYLQPDGRMYQLGADGVLIPASGSTNGDADGDVQELGAVTSSGLAGVRDYVARARFLMGKQPRDQDPLRMSAVDARRAIAKLERATAELRQGILADDDPDRRTQAEVLLHAFSRDLERRRLTAGEQGLVLSGYDDDIDLESSDDEDGIGSPRPASVRSGSTDYFGRPRASGSRAGPTDLTPHLSQAPDFRVPTHEAPQKVPTLSPPMAHAVHAQWERDDSVSNCRDCGRRFTFLLRRHHCRRCGRIFCDRCSSYRAMLDPSEIVQDPVFPESAFASGMQRVCESCHQEVNALVPPMLLGNGANSLERIVVDSQHLVVPSRRQSTSQLSDLAECPVCGSNLDDLGTAAEQEAHVKACLEGGTGAPPRTGRYLVYPLPAGSVLVGTECVICLEEFVEGSMIARLSCLCSFHSNCLSSWLQRGKSCPVHAR